MVDTLPEITNFYDNFYDHNAVVSDLCDGKSLNKIAITFFSYFPWLLLLFSPPHPFSLSSLGNPVSPSEN